MEKVLRDGDRFYSNFISREEMASKAPANAEALGMHEGGSRTGAFVTVAPR